MFLFCFNVCNVQVAAALKDYVPGAPPPKPKSEQAQPKKSKSAEKQKRKREAKKKAFQVCLFRACSFVFDALTVCVFAFPGR